MHIHLDSHPSLSSETGARVTRSAVNAPCARARRWASALVMLVVSVLCVVGLFSPQVAWGHSACTPRGSGVKPVWARSARLERRTMDTVEDAFPRDTTVMWSDLRSQMGQLRGHLTELVRARIDTARAHGRTLFLEVGATWCGPCRELEASLHTPAMIAAFAGTSIVHLDANEWDLETDMAPMGIKGGGMPLIIALDTTGHAIAQLNGVIQADSLKQFFGAHRWPHTKKSPRTQRRGDAS